MSEQEISDILKSLKTTTIKTDRFTDRLLSKKLKLTSSQFKILVVLKIRKNATQRSIADFWNITEASVSRQINLLVKQKNITKKKNNSDLRAYLLCLTAKGKKTAQKATSLINKTFAEVLKPLSASEKTTLIRTLNKFQNIIDNSIL